MAVGLTMSVIPAALACLEQTRRDPLGLLVLPIDQFWKDMCEHSTTHAHVPNVSVLLFIFFRDSPKNYQPILDVLQVQEPILSTRQKDV